MPPASAPRPAPDGEVDRRRDHASVLDRLEDRGELGREVDVVEVHDGVVDRLLGAADFFVLPTEEIFTRPREERTEAYITGRFG